MMACLHSMRRPLWYVADVEFGRIGALLFVSMVLLYGDQNHNVEGVKG